MLVLSRKKSEVIVVSVRCPDGPEIRIVVLELGHGYVKLGIEAPKDVRIHRAEVLQRMLAHQGTVSLT